MRLIMCAKITFPASRDRKELIIRKVNEVHIESSWKELTSRAEITIPRKIKFIGDKDRGVDVTDVFRRGDAVKIELGYDGEFIEEFTGYITQVSANMPVVIKCEDEMWKLKQLPVNYANKSVTLDRMLKDICSGYQIDAKEGVKLGSVRFSKTTVAKVLKKLEDDFNLHSYMKGKQLVCGKYYSDDTGSTPVTFDLERNLVSNDLNYRTKEEVVLKITANGIKINGKRIKYEKGEEGGDTLTLNYFNIETVAELEKQVNDDYDKAHRDKFEGSITAFGKPSVRHGIRVKLKSDFYKDREGEYYIDGVTKTMNSSGYRQQIQIGGKAN